MSSPTTSWPTTCGPTSSNGSRGTGTRATTLVIVSASFTSYLDPIAARLGFAAVLATELAVGDDGRLTGELVRPNVRGAEKVRRLDEWLGATAPDAGPAFVWAYGDSSGDRELLGARRPGNPGRRTPRTRLDQDLGARYQ